MFTMLVKKKHKKDEKLAPSPTPPIPSESCLFTTYTRKTGFMRHTHPQGRCTEIQELQMTTVLEDNVYNFAVEGTSDDLDVPIKAVFADTDYVNKNNLCSINRKRALSKNHFFSSFIFLLYWIQYILNIIHTTQYTFFSIWLLQNLITNFYGSFYLFIYLL